MEISQECIKKSSLDTKSKLTDDLCRLLQVRDRNKGMIEDWMLYLNTSKFNKLSPGEIYLAFQMALSRELVDIKGNGFDILPELSNNTTGKVLDAYVKFKNEDNVYQLAKNKLKQLALPDVKEPTDEQKKNIREGFLKVIYQEILTDGYSHGAHLLFHDLENSGKLVISVEDKKKLYSEQLAIYIPAQKEYIQTKGAFNIKHAMREFNQLINSGKPLTTVVNKCRSISVCSYLKDFTTDFETFKNIINHD